MPKLSDTQAILLTSAANRADASLLPLPDTVATAGAPKALAALLKQGFAEERETTDGAAIHRTNDDIRHGLFATPAGLAAIGIESDATDGNEAPTPPAPAEPRTSKTASVLAMLQRAQGATLPELIAATSWLPHTTRAALTGLRKKGHAIERSKRDDATCYRAITA